MIGNSLRTDILPAVTAGIHSIYIKQPNEWQYNIVELQPNPDTSMYTITALEEVPQVIHENIQQQQKGPLVPFHHICDCFIFEQPYYSCLSADSLPEDRSCRMILALTVLPSLRLKDST